jgi:glycerophosphoryl diester phosphodiesterase
MPENTLPAFAAALSIGVTTLELDVGVSKDGVVVVSHDPHLNPAIVRLGDGSRPPPPGPALRNIDLNTIKSYDVCRLDPSSRNRRRFPEQKSIDGVKIPTLGEVLALVRKSGNDKVRLNVETKLRPDQPDLAPPPKQFAALVIKELQKGGMMERSSIQSFDWRTLREVGEQAPKMTRVYLSVEQRWLDNIERGRPGSSPWTADLDVDDFGGSVPRMIQAAGGKVWSPYHKDLTTEALAEAHNLGLQVVVWTVNKPEQMRVLIELGVDGIISDYPNLLRQVMAERGMKLPKATPVIP